MALRIPFLIFISAILLSGCATTNKSAPALASPCKVVGISDGDTLTIRCEGQPQEKVRLAEIDAPEKGQDYGTRSRESLAEMCFGKPVTLDRQKKPDRYGRTIARVNCDGTDANAEQVRRGMAWVYDAHVTDRTLYGLQDEAREAKRGLWAGEPVRPWEFRKNRKEKR
jgi:endonuclease YncB( thermonuclease family)